RKPGGNLDDVDRVSAQRSGLYVDVATRSVGQREGHDESVVRLAGARLLERTRHRLDEIFKEHMAAPLVRPDNCDRHVETRVRGASDPRSLCGLIDAFTTAVPKARPSRRSTRSLPP